MVDAAFAATLWNPFFAKTGIRPEWIVPVLASESSINPAAPNSAGYPYGGINQISYSYLQARGIDPATYLTWSSSQQLAQIVTGYMQAQVAAFGPLQSGTRVYQSNFLPATLRTAKTLDSVIASRPAGGCPGGKSSNFYCANQGLDWQHDGTITVGDLAHFVAGSASLGYVKNIIASAYAIAPAGVGPETDPVLGLDFSSGMAGGPTSYAGPILLGLVGLAGIGLLAAYDAGYFERRR